jgi:hypothetical protein
MRGDDPLADGGLYVLLVLREDEVRAAGTFAERC